MKKNIIFSSVWDTSNAYLTWRANQWDYTIVLVYYGDNPERAEVLKKSCDIFFASHGSKFQNFEKFSLQLDYDYIFLIDDDIRLPPDQIEKCFSTMIQKNIDIASPSHSLRWKISWFSMISRLWWIRQSNFVEMTAMVMSKWATEKFLAVYKNYRDYIVGYGIDLMISSVCYAPEKPFYIFDFCRIVNPRTKIREIDKLQPARMRRQRWEAIAPLFPITPLRKQK